MAENYIAKLTELRTEAMKDLGSCEPFLIVKALDEAVAALGGERIIGAGIPADHMARPSHNTFSPGKIRRRLVVPQRVSQSDAAEAALLANQAPMPVGLLMEAAIGKGANIRGDDPLANFRSTLSKDDRFYSVKRNNMYFWWLVDVELPEGWQEAPDLLSRDGSDASVVDDQEGGEANATAT